MDKKEVIQAYEILLIDIEALAEVLNGKGATAFHREDYSQARSAIEEATRLAEFRENVRAL